MSVLDRARRFISYKGAINSYPAAESPDGQKDELHQEVKEDKGIYNSYNSFNSYKAPGADDPGVHRGTRPNLSAKPWRRSQEHAKETSYEINEFNELSPGAWVSAPSEAAQNYELNAPRPDWTDDRAWISAIRHAPDEATKQAALAKWVAAAGGEACGRTAVLPALRPHCERRLAELELRRMCRQLGLEVLEEEV
jgi:hypothetical protein